MEKGILPVSRYDCRVRLLMPKRLHTASLSSHCSVSGGLPMSFSTRWIKSANSERCCPHALRSMIMSFHCLNFVLITLLLLSKQTVMQSIAVLLGCKSKPSEAPLQEMRISREIERKQEKRPKEIHLCYCGNEMRCRLVPFIAYLLVYRQFDSSTNRYVVLSIDSFIDRLF